MEQPINILIVDDELKNLAVLETVLDDPGYRLFQAKSADEALMALVSDEFALLILDIRLPGMSGFELAQVIRERKKTSRVPIIFLTAHFNEDQHVLEGYQSGAVDYLLKPVDARVLRSKVAIFAELYRMQRDSRTANRALQAEVDERRRVEAELRELNDTLEQRVTARTHALRDSEERLRLAQDAAHIGTFDYNLVTGEGVWTPEQEAIYGLRTGAFGGTLAHWKELVHPDDREETSALVQRAQATGLPVEGEWRTIWPDKSVHWLLGRFQVLKDSTGRALRLTGVNIDITVRKCAQEQLSDADRRKDEFLATLAHELRSPLAPMKNAVQLLHMRGPIAPELAWARDLIDRQVQAMTRLIDDLLDVSRITRGRIELRREYVELAQVVQGAVETSRPLIDAHSHELTVTLPTRAVVVDADVTRLAQVFQNLLSNAAKYTERGGRIVLRAEREGSDVVVSVKDSGIGIPTEKLGTIFEMFAQVEGALDRSQGGLGIGLCLAKRLVEMHGGDIEARSEGAGTGSEFVVRLPIAVQQTYEQSATTHNDEAPSAALRVVVVDDNRDSASSLATLLEMVGHDVRVAHDGEEAIAVANDFLPHVLLCDIGLPKLNGYDVCRRIRREPWGERMTLIAVTGWGQDDDRQKSEAAGFDRHMVKPVDPRALMQLLAEMAGATH